VVVAFNAGNLKAVAESLRAKFSTIKLVICADNDISGVGLAKANEAAKLVKADVVMPDFGDNRPEGVSDFNDLHQLQGLDAVKQGVAQVARVQVAEAKNSEWAKPSELLQDAESSPYPLDALPSGLGDALREVLDFVQCPIALAACSALSALSVSAQHLANVRRAEGLISPVSLYTLAIADSGERKTSVDKLFTSAITAWESEQEELAKPDVKRYQVEHDSWSMKYDGLKQKIKETAKAQKPTDSLTAQLHQLKDAEPLPVRVPRLIYGDSTPEQLGYSLAKIYPSGAVLSSEAGIVFGGSGMTGDSAMRNMALLNVLWEGGTHTIDRRTSESYKVQGARLTMGLAVQSDTVRAFFDSSKQLARGTGFAARFLIAYPASTQGTRLFKEPPKSFPKLSAFNERINQLLNKTPMLTDAGGLAPPTLDLSPEAKEVWIDFHNQVEMELRVGGDMVDARDVASKAADNVARLAALFHLYEWHSDGQINADLVSAATVIVTWHLYEAKRFLNQIATPVHINNAMKLDAYILRYCKEHKTNQINKNHVRRNGSIRDKKVLDEAISELVEANRIRVVIDDRTSIVQVNPELLGGDYA
jgi:putative DNA primase/helicase